MSPGNILEIIPADLLDTLKCLFTPLFWLAILTRKVGQSGLVFGVRSGFISRSVCLRLQVSVCSGCKSF